MFKVNNRNTRTRYEIYSKLTVKTPERRQWYCSGVFIVNFEHISHLNLVFLMLTLSKCRLGNIVNVQGKHFLNCGEWMGVNVTF